MSAMCCPAPYDFGFIGSRQLQCEPVYHAVIKPESQTRPRRSVTGTGTLVPGSLASPPPLGRCLSVDPAKDYSSPLQVDCSIEYDLPRVAKPPPGSEPLLLIAKPAAWSNPVKSSSVCSTPGSAPTTNTSPASFFNSAAHIPTPVPCWLGSSAAATGTGYLNSRSFKENGFPQRLVAAAETRPCPCCQIGLAEGVSKLSGATPPSMRWTPYAVPSRQMAQHAVKVTRINSIKHHMVLWRSIEIQNRSMTYAEKPIKIRI